MIVRDNRAGRIALAMSRAEVPERATALSGVLKPYQCAGTAYALANLEAGRGTILGDPPGLGKTAQAINAFETAGRFPVLIVCPASLRANWLNEISRWTPHRSAAVSNGHDIPKTDYVVMSYEAHTRYQKEQELAA